MSEQITITVSDRVFNEIEKGKGNNRSEFIEELIRIGLKHYNENLLLGGAINQNEKIHEKEETKTPR